MALSNRNQSYFGAAIFRCIHLLHVANTRHGIDSLKKTSRCQIAVRNLYKNKANISVFHKNTQATCLVKQSDLQVYNEIGLKLPVLKHVELMSDVEIGLALARKALEHVTVVCHFSRVQLCVDHFGHERFRNRLALQKHVARLHTKFRLLLDILKNQVGSC